MQCAEPPMMVVERVESEGAETAPQIQRRGLYGR